MTEENLNAQILRSIKRELGELWRDTVRAQRDGDAYVYVTPRKLINLFIRLDQSLWVRRNEKRICRSCEVPQGEKHQADCWVAELEFDMPIPAGPIDDAYSR